MSDRLQRPPTVRLPSDVTRPFEVFVNGVAQVEGRDFVVRGDSLVFEGELREEGRLGMRKWTSMVLGISGSYGRNDSVDVVYERDGMPVVATKLPIT